MVINYNKEGYNELIKNNILVYFYADWCSKCKMLNPILEEITSINILKVNVDKYKKLARKEGVMSLPCLILYDSGIELKRHIGIISRSELNDFINNK